MNAYINIQRFWIGIIADTETTFPQIGLHQVDCDATRFLWLKDINGKVTDNKIQIYRFARLPFGIIPNPFLLSATTEHHLDETNTTTANQIKDNIYEDNLIMGTNNGEETLQLYKEAKVQLYNQWISVTGYPTQSLSTRTQVQMIRW